MTSDKINQLKNLHNDILLIKTKELVNNERKLQVEFLHHLKEIERRKLFLVRGFSSLFDYVTKELQYSESSAYRRIQAMRLLKDLPELENKLITGSLNLTTASQLQSHFKKSTFLKRKQDSSSDLSDSSNSHPSNANSSLSNKTNSNSNTEADHLKEAKKDLLEQIENKSTREVEKHLLNLPAEHTFGISREDLQNYYKKEIRLISSTTYELKIILSEELKQKLDQLKNLMSHIDPAMNYQSLIERIADRSLSQLDPEIKASQKMKRKTKSEAKNKEDSKKTKQKGNSRPTTDKIKSDAASEIVSDESKSKNESKLTTDVAKAAINRHIPISIKEKVWVRDQGCCVFIDPLTKRKCGSKHQVQIDHIHPFALNGQHTEENLRLLCSAHNQFRAEQSFGKKNFSFKSFNSG